LYEIFGDSHESSMYQNVQICTLEVNTGCFTIVETKRLGTNPGF